jgi:hypothetical protein
VSAVVVVAEKDVAPDEVLRPDHVVMSPEVLNSALIASSTFGRAIAVLRDPDWLFWKGLVQCVEMLVQCAGVPAVRWSR